MRTTDPEAGMPAGSEGTVIGRYTNDGTVVVRFWDGGPLRVSPDALELVSNGASGPGR